MYMCATLDGTISLSSPTRALPVARILFSPLGVRGMSEVPVCRPLSDHSVSPWRIMKARGVVIVSRVEGEIEHGRSFAECMLHDIREIMAMLLPLITSCLLVRYFR